LELSTPLIVALFFLATMIGALPPVMRRWGDKGLHLFIALSAGIFLGTVFLHILPELAHVEGGHEGEAHSEEPNLLPWVAALVGFLGLFLLEKVWLRGFEDPAKLDRHGFVWVSTYIALGLHAFAGGLGLSALASKEIILLPLLWHKLTESFSLTTVLRLAGVRTRLSWACIVFFALATPIGYLFGTRWLTAGPGAEAVLVGLASGTFIYVAACDLLPEVFHHLDKAGPRIAALLLGILAAGLFPHHAGTEMEGGLFLDLVLASWDVFLSMAPYLLFGFLIAGLLSQWLRPEWLAGLLAKDNLRSVGIASVVGAPLPLCSCSVVPVAASLRKAGASKGATSAFLVATPETGVDSVSVTYGLLDPLMTIVRPVASILSALVTGFGVNLLVKSGKDDAPNAGLDAEVPKSCCESDLHVEPSAHDHAPEGGASKKQRGFVGRVLHFAFVEMLDDLAGALLIGILLSGLIAAVIPESAFDSALLQGSGGIFLMLLIGIPVYVCAASSTPIAATLILKGLSPGAALVFLLAGPATNLATLTVMTRYLGKRVVLLHIAVLAVVTLLLGFATDGLYGLFDIEPQARLGMEHEGTSYLVGLVSALIFAGLLAASYWRRLTRSEHEGC